MDLHPTIFNIKFLSAPNQVIIRSVKPYRQTEVRWAIAGIVGARSQPIKIVTGGAAGFTGGASLLTTAAAAGTANAVGGAASRLVQGQETSLTDVAIDATIGAGIGAAGNAIGSAVKGFADDLTAGAKGKLGEAITEVKYAFLGYFSKGKAKVPTGGLTPTGRIQKAHYDHDMRNIFTGNRLTVESKFNKSGYTKNQNAARGNVTTPGGVVESRTTSAELGRAAAVAATSTGAGAAAQQNRER